MTNQTARTFSLYKFFAITVLALFMSACGFQLKGIISLDDSLKLAVINKTGQSSFSVFRPLERNLQANGVKLVGNINANYQINLLEERQERRTSTISSSNGIDEYELRTTITFEILDRDNEIVLAPQTLKLERTYDYNPNQLTASDTEESQLRTEMSERLASQIVRIYSAIKPAQ
ncbi:LPS-assembly lipoprotein LptE [Aliamphritea ceti]|uniref:LPS-assembly lipoprotein LptE n=1 Tax=Aliamphritea ceti TaxID=1524258 RepID=UPI0021C4434A|nr:LPS assembly lipoprotein LptE [Aliamphritea ceti]